MDYFFLDNSSSYQQNPREVLTMSDNEYTEESNGQTFHSFEAFGLQKEVVERLGARGYACPTEFQKRLVPLILGHRDVVAQDNLGDFPYIAFAISFLRNINFEAKFPEALILARSRAEVRAIHEIINYLGEPQNLICHSFAGGTNIREATKKLEQGGHAIVGTPSYMVDLFSRVLTASSSLKTIILVGADEMLSGSDNKLTYEVFRHLPSSCQFVMVSSTMTDDTDLVINRFMNDPVEI